MLCRVVDRKQEAVLVSPLAFRMPCCIKLPRPSRSYDALSAPVSPVSPAYPVVSPAVLLSVDSIGFQAALTILL